MLGLNLDYPLLLSTVIEHAARHFGDIPPIVAAIGRTTVRSDHPQRAERAAGWRRPCAGFGRWPGWVVGSLAWNTHRHFELFYGVGGVGGVLHTANPRLPPEQIIYTINFTGYRRCSSMSIRWHLAEQLAPRLERWTGCVVMAARDDMPATDLPNVLCYEDLIEAATRHSPGRRWTNARPARCASPPARPASRRACFIRIAARCCRRCPPAAAMAGRCRPTTAVTGIPGFFHCNGWAVPFLAPMYGAKLVLPGRRADSEWLHR